MRSVANRRTTRQWVVGAGALFAGYAVACLALHVMTHRPSPLGVWLLAGLAVLPVAYLGSRLLPGPDTAERVLHLCVGAASAAAVLAATYLVIVAGIQGPPKGHERDVLLASLVAALVGGLLVGPVRTRLVAAAVGLAGRRDPSSAQVLANFGARMTRSVPMDELLLQLAESLHATIARGDAEIWTGTGGVLARTVSVPTKVAGHLELGEHERRVVGQARIGGPHWTSVWLPQIAGEGDADVDYRVVPIAHLGDLLGLVVVRRAAPGEPYSDEDERLLVELARQLGLALHNVRLDSALQASLAELARRNEELQASRLRIVTAADTSRREIERNLHDGAQQHLVALAVKIGLAQQIASDGDTQDVVSMLETLRGDVQTTIGELRELAHGIYPPLLRDRGLAEALRTAAVRSPLPCAVDVDLPGRYPEQAETATYFCCLEAMQNAAKHAGSGARLTISVRGDAASLRFEVADDGVGFDPTADGLGHGFVNMQDRLGAIGGELSVESAPSRGTTVRATIPTAPRPLS